MRLFLRIFTLHIRQMPPVQPRQTNNLMSDSVRDRLALINMLGERGEQRQRPESRPEHETVVSLALNAGRDNFEEMLASYERYQERKDIDEICVHIIKCLDECIERVREMQQNRFHEGNHYFNDPERMNQSCTRCGNCQGNNDGQLPFICVGSLVLTNRYLYESIHRSIVQTINEDIQGDDSMRNLVMDAVDQIVRGRNGTRNYSARRSDRPYR